MTPRTDHKTVSDKGVSGDLYQELKEKVSRLAEFARESSGVGKDCDYEQLFELIVEQTVSLMRAPVCILRLLSRDAKRLILKASYGLSETSEFKGYISLGKSISGRVVKNGTACIINDLDSELQSSEHVLVEEERLHSLLAVPLLTNKKAIGSLTVYSTRLDNYKDNDVNIMSILANQAAMITENGRLTAQTRIQSLNTISVLANVIDTKDTYTRGHSEKVMRYSLLIAEALGLPEKEKEIIQYASLLHDIGKIGVDIGVLKKEGPLDKKEWEQIHAHPQIGAEIVDNTGLLGELVPVILHHHERYEGGGYPSPERKTKNIPIGARILAVADAFEAMTSDRPYRKSLSMQEAKEELKKCSGTQFDPKVVDVFITILEGKNI